MPFPPKSKPWLAALTAILLIGGIFVSKGCLEHNDRRNVEVEDVAY